MPENLHWPGIEPGSLAWEARILPLNHQCLLQLKSQFKEREAGAQEAKKQQQQKQLPKVNSQSNTKTFCIDFRSTDPLSTIYISIQVIATLFKDFFLAFFHAEISSEKETTRQTDSSFMKFFILVKLGWPRAIWHLRVARSFHKYFVKATEHFSLVYIASFKRHRGSHKEFDAVRQTRSA